MDNWLLFIILHGCNYLSILYFHANEHCMPLNLYWLFLGTSPPFLENLVLNDVWHVPLHEPGDGLCMYLVMGSFHLQVWACNTMLQMRFQHYFCHNADAGLTNLCEWKSPLIPFQFPRKVYFIYTVTNYIYNLSLANRISSMSQVEIFMVLTV